jgi:hypothetical protein
VRIWQPWETAGPAGLALLLVALAVGAGAWRWLVVPRRVRLPAALLLAGAILVRLVVIPAWTGHTYDGHEAEYWDLYRGALEPTRGGTVLYPAMQWLWWGLGRVLPHNPQVPITLMALVGGVGALVTGAAVGRLTTPAAGWLAAGLVVLHPVHAAWSTSAYNVVLPQALGAGVLWCGAVLATSRRAPRTVAWLGAGLWVLAVATRMEAGLIGIPAALLVVLVAPQDLAHRVRLRDRAALLPALVVGLGLAVLAAFPLVYPGEIPGADERVRSLSIHWPMLDYYLPRAAPLWVGVCAVGAVAALRRWPAATVAMVVGALANHFALATFDDLGDRHMLTALPALVFGVAAGGAAVSSLFPRPRARLVGWVGAGVVGLAMLLPGLVDQRARFYGSEEAYAAVLDAAPWDALPRWSLQEAKQRDGVACGWVAEDPRVAAAPVASHFNLLDPTEAAGLRGPDGCLRWCADVQDWRWSSRGVRDRGHRLERLYFLHGVGVVEEPESGYACLVLEVGDRACCGTVHDSGASDPGDPVWHDPGGNRDPGTRVGPAEEHGRAALPHSRLP